MKRTHPLHGRAKALAFITTWALLIAGLWMTTTAAPIDDSFDFRQIQNSIDQVNSNVAQMEQMLNTVESQLGGTDRLREIQALLQNVTGDMQSLQGTFASWQNSSPSHDSLQAFHTTLTHLGQSAHKLQRYFEPQGITHAEGLTDLQELRFSSIRISESVRKLGRLTHLQALLFTPDYVQDFSILDLFRILRASLADVEKVQSLAHSISPAQPAGIDEPTTLLDEVAQGMQQFEGELQAIDVQVQSGQTKFGSMIDTSSSAIDSLYGLVSLLNLSTEAEGATFDSTTFTAALSLVHASLLALNQSLHALNLMEDSPASDPFRSLVQFDKDANCLISNDEFLDGLEQWIAGSIDRPIFSTLADAWVMVIPICNKKETSTPIEPSAPAAPMSIVIRTRLTASGVAFNIQGTTIISSQVEVFNASGARIAMDQSSGRHLIWNLRTCNGRPIANGVYFYRVMARTADGKLFYSQIKKLALLR
ncbi:hypothetical protein HY229_00025 [Candidatus Acetothermia bacterium]|nr:hypothetical protein [Candidatus Acetothermia bacterium]MBI3642482.1 hypothetical protein [Candidatus Acetothermia bacterium]